MTEDPPERGGGQLLGDLPDQALGVVGEQHQVLLPVNVKRGQQTKCVLWVLLLLEDSAEVLDLGRGCAILVDGVVDFVLGAGADLHWGVVLLVTIKAGQVARYCLSKLISINISTRSLQILPYGLGCGGNQDKTREGLTI